MKKQGEQKIELAPNQERLFIIRGFFTRFSLFLLPQLILGFILKACLNAQATNTDAVSDFTNIRASTWRSEQCITPYWKVMDARFSLCDGFQNSFFIRNFPFFLFLLLFPIMHSFSDFLFLIFSFHCCLFSFFFLVSSFIFFLSVILFLSSSLPFKSFFLYFINFPAF